VGESTSTGIDRFRAIFTEVKAAVMVLAHDLYVQESS
jgi:hypothetical protein